MRQTDDDKENLIMKSYRFRVLENKISDALWNYLKQSFGNQRFVWNHFLREMENHYQSQNELKKYYKENNIEIPKTFSTTLSFNDLCSRLTMLKNMRIDLVVFRPLKKWMNISICFLIPWIKSKKKYLIINYTSWVIMMNV